MTSTARVSDINSLPEKQIPDRAEPHEAPDGADRRLVQRCAQGDAAALRELVAQYQPRLHHFLHPILGSREDAEEALLDVFLRVWQQSHRFEGRARVSTWLYRIAANAACDRLRRRKGQARAASLAEGWTAGTADSLNAEEAALNHLEREERSRQLQQALQALRVEDRLLLVLYYQEDLSYEEIGQVTKHPYPVLKMRLLRARRRLRALLEPQIAFDAQAMEDIG